MLNPSQKEAIEASPGPLIIMAGAGTGKTHTLTHRVASLIKAGNKPQRILLLTFTRKAADEMLERVQKLCSNASDITASGVFGGTFHACGYRILNRLTPGRKAGILDESDAKSLIKKLLNQDLYLSLKEDKNFTPAKIISVFSYAVNTQEDIKYALESKIGTFSNDKVTLLEAMAEDYKSLKKEQLLLDYDDILVEWQATLLEKNSGDKIRALFDCILVDEFQDCNQLQMNIIQELVRGHQNFTAVGDDCQSIYGFRGARTHQVDEFCQLFPNTKIVHLTENYRSTQNILDLSNTVIARAKDVIPKQLNSASNKPGKDVDFLFRDTDKDVAVGVIDEMITSMLDGIPLEDQAVLYRSSHHCRQLEMQLRSGQMAYQKFGGIKFTDSKHCKDFFSLLNAGENPRHEAAHLRCFSLIKGIGTIKANRLWLARLSGTDSPYKNTKAFAELVAIWSKMRNSKSETSNYLMELLNWYGNYASHLFENFEERLNDLSLIIKDILQSSNLQTYLTDQLLSDSPEDNDITGPTLSTIHSAKGKEWRKVYILNCTEGAIPLKSDSEHIEEERRLFYVALTRAKEEMTLCAPKIAFGKEGQPVNLELSSLLYEASFGHTCEETESDIDDFDDEIVYIYD